MGIDDQKENRLDGSLNPEPFLRQLTAGQNRIYAFILTRVANFADADDIMQETVAVMWRKYAQFEPGTDFVSWGVRIAHYEILRFHRGRRGFQFRQEVDEALFELAISKGQEIDRRIEALRGCLSKLDRREREIIRMRYEQNLACKNLAERMRVSAQTISKTLGRIHDALLRCIRGTLAAEEID